MSAKILNGQTDKQKMQLGSLYMHCLLFLDKISYRQSRKKLALYIILQQLMLLQPNNTQKFQESWKKKYKWLRFDKEEKKIISSHFQGNFKTAKTPATPQGSEQNKFQTDSLKAHDMP